MYDAHGLTKKITSDKFSFRQYIICWGNLSLSKIIGGGGGGGGAPRTAASFYSANMCIFFQSYEFVDILQWVNL